MNNEYLIDKYFENTLSAAEKQLFDDELKNNKAFADEVALQHKIKSVIHISERNVLKKQLQLIEHSSSKKIAKQVSIKWWYVAASVIIIAITTWLVVQKPSSNELFAAYYQPYPNVVAPIVRGNNNHKNDGVYQAFSFYENKEYAKAALMFRSLYQQTNNDYFIVYEAICLLENSQFQQAKLLLENKSFLNADVRNIRNWYLALIYIQQNNFEKAKPLLFEVEKEQGVLQESAKVLLSKLP